MKLYGHSVSKKDHGKECSETSKYSRKVVLYIDKEMAEKEVEIAKKNCCKNHYVATVEVTGNYDIFERKTDG